MGFNGRRYFNKPDTLQGARDLEFQQVIRIYHISLETLKLLKAVPSYGIFWF